MKPFALFLSAVCTFFFLNGNAQSTAKDPFAYLNKISEGQNKIMQDYLAYISAVSHGKSAKKVAQKRSELLSAVTSSRARVSHLPEFDGDTMLRYTAFNYLNMTYVVLKEDYAKIMDLEEIAEQSYDNMEAYLTMQKKAGEKVEEAYAQFDKKFHAFALKNNIRIEENNTEEAKKMAKVGRVNDYYNEVYLAFFKCSKGEMYMIDATTKKDLNAIEQTKVALQKYIGESTEKLNAIAPFEGDASFLTITKKLIEFYQSEVKDKMPIVADFMLKSEKFEKLKAAMEKKSASERTQQDVDQYNAAVNDMNAAVNNYNKVNTELNNTRSRLINEWNKVGAAFKDKHMPVYNK